MKIALVLMTAIALNLVVQSQEPGSLPASGNYHAKFAGNKARSDAEAAALGYMRTVVSAQKVYKKKHDSYATSLSALVGTGSFTRRMAEIKRGAYRVNFRARGEGYSLTMSPVQFTPEQRAFYVDETGVFRTELTKAANSSSPVLE